MMRYIRRCSYVVVQDGFAPRTNKGPDTLSFMGCRCLAIHAANRLATPEGGVEDILGYLVLDCSMEAF